MSQSLFQQPKYVILPILVDWVAMNDLGALDSALCSKKYRSVFLSWLGGTNTIFFSGILHEKYNGPPYWKWLSIRNVQVYYVSVYFQSFERVVVKPRTKWERFFDILFRRPNTQLVSSRYHDVQFQLPYKSIHCSLVRLMLNV